MGFNYTFNSGTTKYRNTLYYVIQGALGASKRSSAYSCFLAFPLLLYLLLDQFEHFIAVEHPTTGRKPPNIFHPGPLLPNLPPFLFQRFQNCSQMIYKGFCHVRTNIFSLDNTVKTSYTIPAF